MNFREIIELAKKRGLHAGNTEYGDINEAIRSDSVYACADIANEGSAGNIDMVAVKYGRTS